MKVVDVVYYSHNDFATSKQVVEKHRPSFGYVRYLKNRVNIELVKHFKKEVDEVHNGVQIKFFKRRNNFWHIPFKTHNYIRSIKPDIVIIEGLVFPLQLIALKLLLRKSCSIIAQHHGESPFKGYKRIFQIIADKCTSAYLFTAKGNSYEWIEKKVMSNDEKCFEVLEASTFLSYLNKQRSRSLLNIKAGLMFLWVGRLNENKDPITVLEAFNKFLATGSNAVLYMVFHTEELLPKIKDMLNDNPLLKNAVTVVGKVDHSAIACWYSAADFYLSASHKEGSGYALLEAMSCKCIPIVTSIPSFQKITNNGEFGFLFPPSDVDYLFAILKSLPANVDELSEKVYRHFKKNLSFKNIADDLYYLCSSLHTKQMH